MKKILLIVCSLLCLTPAFAQEIYNSSGKPGQAKYKQNQTKSGFDPQRLVFGGGLGLAFGTITNIYIAPSVGYRVTDKFAAGISLGYNYYRQRDALLSYNSRTFQSKLIPFTQSIYTGGVWGRYLIIPNILVQAEFEVNNISYINYNKGTYDDKDGWSKYYKDRLSIPSLLLGGGYRQPIGDIGSMYIMAMYDVLQDIPANTRVDQAGQKYSISPYADRIDFRVGFTIGF